MPLQEALPMEEMPTGLPALVTDMADVQALITKIVDYTNEGKLASAEVLADEVTVQWMGIVDRITALRGPVAPPMGEQSSPLREIEAGLPE